MKYFLAVLVILIGAAGVAYGGQDDSPGAQLIGLLMVVVAVVYCVRSARRHGNR